MRLTSNNDDNDATTIRVFIFWNKKIRIVDLSEETKNINVILH